MDQRAEVRIRVHAVSHSQFLGMANTSLEKRFIQAAMNVAAFDRKAGLPRVHECTPDRASGRDFDIRIVEHQHGIFSAEFQNHGQQSSCCVWRDSSPVGTLPVKINLSMAASSLRLQCRRRLGHLEDFLRHARLMQHLRQLNSRKRSEFRGFQTTAFPATSAAILSVAGIEKG